MVVCGEVFVDVFLVLLFFGRVVINWLRYFGVNMIFVFGFVWV